MYRLITRNSYEREMLDKASLKLGLDRAVLQSMSGNKDTNVNGVSLCTRSLTHSIPASYTFYTLPNSLHTRKLNFLDAGVA